MKLAFAVALLVLSTTLMAAFLVGASALDRELAFGLDAGVASAAISLVLAAIGPMLIAAGPRRRSTTKIALVAAIAWLPLSILLAGGLQLSYSGWRSIAWLLFTGFALLAILTAWIMALASRVGASAAS